MFFKTTAEIYKALLEGKKIVSNGMKHGDYIHLVNGKLLYSDGIECHYAFTYADSYKLYEEPKEPLYLYSYKEYKSSKYILDPTLRMEKEVKSCYDECQDYIKVAGPFTPKEKL